PDSCCASLPRTHERIEIALRRDDEQWRAHDRRTQQSTLEPHRKWPRSALGYFGTGFLASAGGQILTNHHVAEPWWQNDELKEMLDQGLEPVIAEMAAYFPGVPRGVPINTEKISSTADVAIVKGNMSGSGIKQVALGEGGRSASSGG